MFIDFLFILLLAMAVFKGLSKGFIVAIFSFAAFMIGLAAALKLSAVVANYLREHVKTDSHWLPFISFALVFIAVALLVRWGAKLVRGAVSLAMLGWADRIAGIALYLLLYMMIFSVLLFFGTQLHLISPQVQDASKSYHYLEPWGPWVINGIGKVIPFFKNIFEDLKQFFDGVGRR